MEEEKNNEEVEETLEVTDEEDTQEEKIESTEEIEGEDDDAEDFGDYIKEMDLLTEDFSDFDDFDLEELQDIKDAIEQVKQQDLDGEVSEETTIEPEASEEGISEPTEMESYLREREQLSEDFSDLEELDLDELAEMKEAISSVASEGSEVEGEAPQPQVVSEELEEKIRLELEKRKEDQKAKIITAEDFQNYVSSKRDKIWYHALYYLVFETEEHSATKEGLYDVLKEVTSKNAIDPIIQQQFFFGLGYILRLKMYDKDIVRYKGGKFTININVENLKKILEENGEPISKRPIITEEERKKMISDFLKDDFLDL